MYKHIVCVPVSCLQETQQALEKALGTLANLKTEEPPAPAAASPAPADSAAAKAGAAVAAVVAGRGLVSSCVRRRALVLPYFHAA